LRELVAYSSLGVRALGEGRLDDKLKLYTVPRLIDESVTCPSTGAGPTSFSSSSAAATNAAP